MTRETQLIESVELTGLELAPSQVWSGVRIVPVLRRSCPGDLRLAKRKYKEELMVVSLDGELMDYGIKYTSYVPHGLVVTWTDDGAAAAAYGTNMVSKEGKRFGSWVRVAHRMAKREEKNRLRILPLHLAMEGFLSFHFGGPEIAWSEYSYQAISRGLDPRWESAVPGRWIRGLEDALRLFEIHDDQVGVLLFVADAFASAFIVSHPDDYRQLHQTLLEDFYGQLIYQYGMLYSDPNPMEAPLDDSKVESVADLRTALGSMRKDWADFQVDMAAGLFGRSIRAEKIYTAGRFQLQRFTTELDRFSDNHIGELIIGDDGVLEYLKTYRLSGAQVRRAYLLDQLAKNDWNLQATAAAFKQSKNELVRRLEKAGFGYLLKEHVLREAQRKRRRR